MFDNTFTNNPTTHKMIKYHCSNQTHVHNMMQANHKKQTIHSMRASNFSLVGLHMDRGCYYTKKLSDGNWHLIFSPLLDRAHREAILACKNRAGIEKAFTASSLCDNTTRPSCRLARPDHFGDHWTLLCPTRRCRHRMDRTSRRCVAPFFGVPPAVLQIDAFELQL